MFEIMLGIALIGSVIAGIFDLKTTEIPDEISFLMIILAIAGWFVYSVINNDFKFLINSLIVGSLFLGIGWAMYRAGQWGGGDALLLGAIFYLLPTFPNIFLFPITFLINLLLVGIIYMFIYTLILGIKHKEIRRYYKDDLKKTWKVVIFIPLLFGSVSFILPIILNIATLEILTTSALFLFVITFLTLFWRYGYVIEKKLFTKRIPTKKLKVGDVIAKSKRWDGIDKNQLEEIRKKKKYITIKEGIRFAPVFSISLIVTITFGNLLFLIIGF